jgi:hypothetical protein
MEASEYPMPQPISKEEAFNELASVVLAHYTDPELPREVLRPSVPILYFGDYRAYTKSCYRIVTVGLNPSRHEFPETDPFARFPSLSASSSTIGEQSYLAALNRYFVTKPYASWFKAFDPILNGLEASYYPGWPSTALHTDICSPLATDPTWSGLDSRARATLQTAGLDLWHSLVELLAPQVMLISVARAHLESIRFQRLSGVRVVYRIERRNPYAVEHWTIDVAGAPCHVVFGQAAQRPFGTISKRDKELVGRFVAQSLLGGCSV